jgi:hypothetical protein
MQAAFGSTREIRIVFLAPQARARFQAGALWDMPEAVLEQAQVPAEGPAKVAHFQGAFLELVAEEAERERVPAAGPAKVAHFQEGFLELVAEEAERGPVPAAGRIFGGLLPVGAAKVTTRKEAVGRARQPGCAADAPPAQARWLLRPD